MPTSVVALTGLYETNFPTWGRCFWQDPNDGALFLAFSSGTNEVDYIYSLDSGNVWSTPARLFPVDNFSNDNNFDICMDRRGHIHSVFKWQGSGCYQFTGKSGSTWNNASGVGPAGFCLTTDGASSSKGLHASLFVADGPLGLFNDPVLQFPAARIACKRADQEVESWFVSHPFNTYPIMQSGTVNGIPTTRLSKVGDQAGPGGGYPVISDGGNFNGLAVAYSASGALIRWPYAQFGVWDNQQTLDIVRDPNHTGAGSSGLLPFGSQMCFTSGVIGKFNPILISSASGYELYSTSADTNGPGTVFRRVDSTYSHAILGDKRRAPNGIPWMVAAPSGNIFGLMPNSGTLVDVSHGNTPATIHYYFLGPDSLGRQSIHRVLCSNKRDTSSSASSHEFSSVSHFASGERTFAPANNIYAGGRGLISHWKSFKAVRHPVRPGEGVTKKELVVTIGSEPTYPSGFNFVVWDYNQSVAGQESLHYPEYDFNYVTTSGDQISVFVGVSQTSRVTNVASAFDFNINTDATVNSGSFMLLEFARPTLIDRVELVTFGTLSSNRFPGVIFSGSMDGTNWHRLHVMSSGHSNSPIKLSAEHPQLSDVDERIDPWIAKYLKLDFQQSQKRNTTNYFLTELRLFGPGQITGKYITEANSPTIIRPEASRGTERFNSTPEGSLPNSDWHTYGNFTWGVRASGAWSYPSTLPTRRVPQNGYVGSGIFAGDSNGNGDGFALKPNDCVPPLTSGVVQVNLQVYSTDVSSSGVEGQRTVRFDCRTDYADSDDRLDLYVSSLGASTEGTLIRTFRTPNIDWTTVPFDIGQGTWTIKWIYTRGSTSGNSLNSAAVWLDNIVGLNGPAQPSIGGFIEGTATPISGVIHGYMNSKGAMEIHGYMSGAPLFSVINGYLDATVTASGSIHGYMSARADSTIYGYMAGVGTPINSSIYGVMGSGTPNISSRIHGFIRAEGESNRIHGYMFTPDGIVNSIHGYTFGDSPSGIIYGFMPGYERPSGSIHGFLPGNIQFSNIHGYMNTSGIGPDSPINTIHGYLKGEQGSQTIHGYMEGPPGTFGGIHGYMSVGGSTQIYGYLQGAIPSSGSIHGFMDAVGVGSGAIYGYMYGVSGLISGAIHGWLTGVITPSGQIYGFILGLPSGVDSKSACVGHGNVALPSVNAAVIPSSCFN